MLKGALLAVFGAVGHLVGRLPWLCSVLMLTDVQTWGTTIRGGRVLSCRVVAVVAPF